METPVSDDTEMTLAERKARLRRLKMTQRKLEHSLNETKYLIREQQRIIRAGSS